MRFDFARRLQVGSAIGIVVASVLSGGVAFGIFSSLLSTQTDTFNAGHINPATNFTASSVTSSGATLSWTPATQPADATVTSVTITQSPTGGSGCTGLAVTATTCTLTGLSPGTTYTWTLTYSDDNWQAVTTTSATTLSGVTFGGVGSGVNLAAPELNLVVGFPSGTAVGDLVVLVVANNGEQTSDFSHAGDSTGWNQVNAPGLTTGSVYPPQQSGIVGPQSLQVWWHVVSSTTDTSVTLHVSTNASGGATAWVLDYKNVAATIAQNGAIAANVVNNTTTLTPGAFTPASTASTLVLSFAENTITSGTTPTAPTLGTANGFTQDVAVTSIPGGTGNAGIGLSVASENVVTTSAVISPVWSQAAASQWSYVTAGLR